MCQVKLTAVTCWAFWMSSALSLAGLGPDPGNEKANLSSPFLLCPEARGGGGNLVGRGGVVSRGEGDLGKGALEKCYVS